MHATRTLLLCSLSLTLGALASTAQAADDKTLKLYNWADYFAEDTLAKFTAETGINTHLTGKWFIFTFCVLIAPGIRDSGSNTFSLSYSLPRRSSRSTAGTFRAKYFVLASPRSTTVTP